MPDLSTIFRVDKFSVPSQSRDEFLQRISETHQILRKQPGFVRDAILEQVSGSGRFNIVTIAEWENQEAVDRAKDAVMQFHTSSGFSPQATMIRLGVEADIANYKQVGG
jgi:heme-degrading monooxygenase HmoA